MTEKITPLPLADSDRRRLDRRNHIVRCEVTGRWLRFEEPPPPDFQATLAQLRSPA